MITRSDLASMHGPAAPVVDRGLERCHLTQMSNYKLLLTHLKSQLTCGSRFSGPLIVMIAI